MARAELKLDYELVLIEFELDLDRLLANNEPSSIDVFGFGRSSSSSQIKRADPEQPVLAQDRLVYTPNPMYLLELECMTLCKINFEAHITNGYWDTSILISKEVYPLIEFYPSAHDSSMAPSFRFYTSSHNFPFHSKTFPHALAFKEPQFRWEKHIFKNDN
jgi:hypothetical protein